MQRPRQNHAIFIILIPLFMLIIAFIFDFALMFFQGVRIEKVTKNIITSALTYNVNDYYKNVKDAYEKQKITTELLEVKYENESLTVYNSHSYPSFFGKLLGIQNYRAEIHLIGEKENEIIIFHEVPDE